jgi:hypothetical protein
MLHSPLFSGIAGGIKYNPSLSVDTCLQKAGLNTGNFLFIHALRSSLGKEDAVFNDFDYYKAKPLDEFDYIAISAANWINPSCNLDYLADFIESTKLPCLVVGLGVQMAFDGSLPKLPTGTQRFLKIVSERSPFISVRGNYTKSILESYGIHNTWATGCPSLLMYKDKQFSYSLDTTNLRNIVLQGTRHGLSDKIFERVDKSSSLNLQIYRYAIENKTFLLLQSEFPDIFSLKNGSSNEEDRPAITEYLEKIYCCPMGKIKDYLRDRGLLYWNVSDWINGLVKFDCLIGTRIHGVISAILAGIPAILLAHDERTKELGTIMNLPFFDIRQFDVFNDEAIDFLIKNFDIKKFKHGLDSYKKNFIEFYNANNVYCSLD